MKTIRKLLILCLLALPASALAFTVEVLDTRLIHLPGEPIIAKRVQVWMSPCQPINELEVFAQQEDMAADFRFEDLTLDGLPDLLVPWAQGASNMYYTLYPYDEGSGAFRSAPVSSVLLCNHEVLRDKGLIHTQESLGLAGLLRQESLYAWQGEDLAQVRHLLCQEDELRPGILRARVYENARLVWEKEIPLEDALAQDETADSLMREGEDIFWQGYR